MSGLRRSRGRRPRLARGSLASALAAAAAMAGCSGDDDGEPEPDPARDRAREPADDEPAAGVEEAPADALVPARDGEVPAITLPPADPVPPPPRGLPPAPEVAAGAAQAEIVALGEILFFDPRLSGAAEMRCADCHAPEHGFADPDGRSETAAGRPNRRRAPSLYNAAYAERYFWDGSTPALESAIDVHWRGQMDADLDAVAADLAQSPTYRAHFERSFSAFPRPALVREALAAYVRTLRSGDAPWDRFEDGQEGAVGEDAARGFRLFSGKAQCYVCHPPPLYTDRQFHHAAAAAEDSPPDPGRYRVTGEAGDRGAVRTPGLRGVAHGGPYFRDGSADTLEEAVRIMAAGGREGAGRDLEPVDLTDAEIDALVAFLEALTPERSPPEPPEIPAD